MKNFKATLVLVLILLATSAVSGQESSKVRVRLSTSDGTPIAGGVAFLWRAGADQPTETINLNDSNAPSWIAIPAGDWYVIAHAPGHIGGMGTSVTSSHADLLHSVHLPEKYAEHVFLRTLPGATYEVSVVLEKQRTGTVEFKFVGNPIPGGKKYVGLWMEGDAQPSRVVDLQQNDNRLELPEGNWVASPAVFGAPGATTSVMATVRSSDANSVSIPQTTGAAFTVSADRKVEVEFTLSASNVSPSAEAARVALGTWQSGQQRVRQPGVLFLAWQEELLGTLVAFAPTTENDSTMTLEPGLWQFSAELPGHDGPSQISATSSDVNFTLDEIKQPRNGI